MKFTDKQIEAAAFLFEKQNGNALAGYGQEVVAESELRAWALAGVKKALIDAVTVPSDLDAPERRAIC